MDFSQVPDRGAARNALDPTALSAELSTLLGSFSANLARFIEPVDELVLTSQSAAAADRRDRATPTAPRPNPVG
jgi:hypothetical protein